MKLIFVLGFVFGILANFSSDSGVAKERVVTVPQKDNTFTLSIVAPKRKFRRTDQLKLLVMLINSGKKEVYVFGTMEYGYSASLLFHIRDASGKEIKPLGFPDDLTRAVQDDNSAFVKLLPEHFLGTSFFAPLEILNLNKPGKYSIFMEYHSPFSSTEVQVSPFWGKENGSLKSNVVWIEVL
jgi:hypothetical protein